MPRTVQPTLFDTADPAEKSATDISADGRYRYTLTRTWAEGPTVNFVMLNPSTADASVDDPTIRRCIGFAKIWGYGGLVVTNLFAFRATKPEDMKAASDPIGPENDEHLACEARYAALVLCAWGNDGHYRGRGLIVRDRLESTGISTHVLRLTSWRQPAHPLFLPKGLQPRPWKELR